MPYSVNGIGTWYWGKGNVQSRVGRCEFCGNIGKLATYDTTLFFVFFFIPLIPLGRRKVIDECSSCHKHRATSLKQYNAAMQKDLAEALARSKADPRNPETAKQTVGVLWQYRDRDNFEKTARVFAEVFSSNEEILNLLADAHSFFGSHADATAIRRRLLALHDSPENRGNLARALLLSGNPDEAAPLLMRAFEDAAGADTGMLYALVEGYQSLGRHKQALDVLATIARRHPQQAKERNHRRYEKTSTKRLASGKPVKFAWLTKEQKQVSHGPDIGRWLGRIVPPVVACALVALYLANCFSRGKGLKVYLVNGIGTPYTVLVNDSPHALPAGKVPATVKLDEGSWQVAPQQGGPAIEPAEVVYRTPFFLRPFRKQPTLIINPDRTALIFRETTVYSARPEPKTEDDFAIYTGEVFYRLPGMSYEFEEFPQTLTLQDSTTRIRKSRVCAYRPGSDSDRLAILLAQFPKQTVAEHMERMIRYQPDHMFWLAALSTVIQPDALLKFLQPGLSARPVQIQWHRIYQETVERTRPEHNLEAEYRKLAQTEPLNPALKYLLGRVAASTEEQDSLFAASEEGPSPIGFGHFALAYGYLCRARFSDAVDRLDKGLAVIPDSEEHRAILRMALSASGRYERLLNEIRTERARAPSALGLLVEEVSCLWLSGRTNEIQGSVENYVAAHKNMTPPEHLAAVEAALGSHIEYLRGNYDRFAAMTLRAAPTGSLYSVSVVQGKPAEASRQIKARDDTQYDDHLLVYSLAASSGDKATADAELPAAIALLRKGNRTEKTLAAMFAGETPADPGTLERLEILPHQKRIVLMAFGLVRPDLREFAFAEARKHNFHVGFPQRTISDIIGSAPAAAPGTVAPGNAP